MIRTLTVVLLSVQLAGAQSAPSFEVASVKHDRWTGNGRVGVFVSGDTLRAEHTCLYGLVEFAYNLKDEHLSGGPSWAQCGMLASSDLYQVIAKAGDPPPEMAQFRVMLQTLLAERFQLKIHHAEKILPVYNLVAAGPGPKLKESADDAKLSLHVDARVNLGKSIRMTATHVSIAQLMEQFEHYAGRPLFDHTGLKRCYDFELEWDLDNPASALDAGSELFGRSFVTALHQLGLKLEPGTAPFDTVVIDHAEKPSEN